MPKENILPEFELAFEKVKQQLGFSQSLNELDEVFFIRDFMLQEGYVSSNLSRMICHRISSTLISWEGYLHGLLMPAPHNLVNVEESGLFSEKEKEEVSQLIGKIMYLSSKNSLAGISKDKIAEKEFIEESYHFWVKHLQPKLKAYLTKASLHWSKRAKGQIKKEKQEMHHFG